MIASTAYAFALFVSLLWFGAALRYFSFQHFSAAKILMPKSARPSPLFQTMAASIRFLGGFNGAFAVLCATLLGLHLSGSSYFTAPVEQFCLLVAIATAHLSQFAFNVPVLRNGERQGEAYWPVMSGPMRFIFLMDAAQFLVVAAAAVLVVTL